MNQFDTISCTWKWQSDIEACRPVWQ